MAEHPVPAETYNSADPKAVDAARHEAAKRELQLRGVMETLMSTPDGRAWVWRKLERCHINQPSYRPGSFDETAFLEGERNVGNELLAEVLRAAPALYLMMQREAAT